MRAVRVPFEIDSAGSVRSVTGEYAVAAQHLKMLLMTRLGERVMRPRFGTALHEGLFEAIDGAFLADLEGQMRDAVATWEPRIRLLSIQAQVSRDTYIEFDITFTLTNADNDQPSTVNVSIEVGGAVEETT